MQLRVLACLAVLLGPSLPALAKGSPENGRFICNKRGCFDRMDKLDPLKRQCADKVGATYNFAYRHFDGPPAVMDAWLICAGLPPFSGPEPRRLECGNQVGAKFNWTTRHMEGPPQVMQAFRACMGFE